MLRVFGAAPASERRPPGEPPGHSGRSREISLVAAAGLLAGIVATWPVVLHLPTRIPQDLQDPAYFVWQLGWLGHALRTDPAGLWTTNAFLGAENSLAYTDTMLGYAPFAALVSGTGGAVALYNILLILNSGAAFGGVYWLSRVLGAARAGALVGAVAFTFVPWRLGHERHLNVLSTGVLTLALAALAHGYGWRLTGERGEARPRWIIGGWLLAAWQLSLGFAVGLSFSYALALVLFLAVVLWLARGGRRPNWAVVRPTLIGGAVYGLVGIAMALPLLQVTRSFPTAVRTVGALNYHSPPVVGLITAPPESWLWGDLAEGWREGMQSPIEQTLLPGFVLLVLAALGLVSSRWSVPGRIALGAVAVLAALFALGTHAPFGGRLTFLLLFDHAPGWNSVRTSGRLILWVSLALALLAAGLVSRLTKQRLVPAVLAALIAVEGFGQVPTARVPEPPVKLSSLPGPVLVLPITRAGDYLVMAWSADDWPTIANGGSGYDPPYQAELRKRVETFPDAASVAYLRERGVKSVVLMPSDGTPWAEAASRPTEGLGVSVRPEGDSLVYRIEP
ncbi:hypothetical protein [Kineosporia succinea]|uniref:4-amino-4-deoxy-L-arabinose transferase-like glycosyltransferase n=1 Tax=Kineosporia succinea TaxID=84632 RepID=A0ABT9NZS8_9ACTN|nr:hypothetical protein [Kineosporia succinea]MDP9825936.1 hypothetical protein [Kineosporia succinea]